MLTLAVRPAQTPAPLRIHPQTAIPAVTTAMPSGGNGRVFTGDWLIDRCDCHLYSEGYAGVLSRRWNGWAVFTVTRQVAEAIVERHQRDFAQAMNDTVTTGAYPDVAWRNTLRHMTSVSWLADMIVVDSRLAHSDDTSVEIAAPDAGGRYTVGWGWCWDDANTSDIHTVHYGHTR